MQKCQYISNTNKPIHTDHLTLIWVSKQKEQITLSPKADGVYNEIKNKDNIFQCEYVEHLNVYLVFDSKKFHIKHNNTLINRMNWIRSLHPYASKLQIKSINNFKQLNDIIQKDTELLKEYLDNTTDKLKWYPKLVFLLELAYDSFLEILDKNIDDVLLYKTDGWIITNNDKIYMKSYKYKPKNELTIDILYKDNRWFSKECELYNINNINNINDNTIWRCYWDNNTWIPKEQRLDKKIPNNQAIIDNLEDIHNNYITAADLIGKIHNYYYNHDKDIKLNVPDEWINYLALQRNVFRDNILNINQYDIKTILDIGCGKGFLNTIVNKTVHITGIDIDPFNIYELKNKYRGDNYKWIWKDINVYDLSLNLKYDLVILNNTIHTINDVDNFMQKINKITHGNSRVYIHFLDRELLDKYNMEFIKQIDNNLYEFSLPWNVNTIRERIVSSSDLNNIMENNLWKLEHEYTINDGYNEYAIMHKYLVYNK